MKYFLTFCAFFVSLLGFAPTAVLAVDEGITSFDASYYIYADGTVDVTEVITYDFGEHKRQGIFREIPYKYQRDNGKFNVRFSDIAVTDEVGQVHTTDVSREGGDLKIRIGDKGTFISGEHIYKISYTAERVINFFETHDELYWNVTGDGWNVPIDRVTTLVESETGAFTQTDCFTGAFGSTDKCSSISESGQTAIEFTEERLGTGEGMTIVVGLPAGSVTQATLVQEILWFIRDNMLLGFPLIVLGFMYRRWHANGKDPRGRGSIVPRWEIPEGLNPIEVGLIIDESTQKDDLSSLFIDLAIRGYFTITEGDKEIFRKQDYTLTKKKDWMKAEFNKGLEKHEELFLSGIFGGSETVKISDLKNTFFADVKKIKDEVHSDAAAKGYFVKSPQKVRGAYIGAGVATSFFSIWLGAFLQAWLTPVAMGVGFVSGLIIAAFSFAMPQRTIKGVYAKEEIEGLRVYLEKAEKARLDFHNNPDDLKNQPEHTAATFEKYLPYAMVLGVHEAWAEQFEGIYKNGSPEWFSSANVSNFSTASLVNSLGGFASTAHAASVSQPSNASSGGSGFSGGGSGGGFGGGGGGSW